MRPDRAGAAAALLLALSAAAAASAAAPDPDVARQGYGVLKRYCYRCHGTRFEVPRYNVLDRDTLVAPPPAGKRRKLAYVVPGDPDNSLLWKRVGVDEDMPPEDPGPSDAEKAALK